MPSDWYFGRKRSTSKDRKRRSRGSLPPNVSKGLPSALLQATPHEYLKALATFFPHEERLGTLIALHKLKEDEEEEEKHKKRYKKMSSSDFEELIKELTKNTKSNKAYIEGLRQEQKAKEDAARDKEIEELRRQVDRLNMREELSGASARSGMKVSDMQRSIDDLTRALRESTVGGLPRVLDSRRPLLPYDGDDLLDVLQQAASRRGRDRDRCPEARQGRNRSPHDAARGRGGCPFDNELCNPRDRLCNLCRYRLIVG